MDKRIEETWSHLDPARLKATFLEMLEIYSPSGKEEDIQRFIEAELISCGARVQRDPVDEDRYNIRSVMGEAPPEFYLVGHVDTVPATDLDSCYPQEEAGMIRALGSADMKGGCAAMIEAWRALHELPPNRRPNAGLVLVVGEEENGDGSAAFLRTHRPGWAVIGEPTGMSACFAHYGYLEAGFTTCGRRIHSSLPELGHNAVESMLRFLLHLGRDPIFRRKPSSIVYSIRELSSSRAGFVVPDRCEAWIDLHLAPGIDPAAVEDALRQRMSSAGKAIEDLDLDLAVNFSAKGFDLGECASMNRSLEEVYRRLGLPLYRDTFRSHSDGNLFHQAGVKPVILGPGSLETAHTPEEQTAMVQVVEAARVYSALCCENFI